MHRTTFALALLLGAACATTPARPGGADDWIWKKWMGVLDTSAMLGSGGVGDLLVELRPDGRFELTWLMSLPDLGGAQVEVMKCTAAATLQNRDVALRDLRCRKGNGEPETTTELMLRTNEGQRLLLYFDKVMIPLEPFDDARWKAIAKERHQRKDEAAARRAAEWKAAMAEEEARVTKEHGEARRPEAVRLERITGRVKDLYNDTWVSFSVMAPAGATVDTEHDFLFRWKYELGGLKSLRGAVKLVRPIPAGANLSKRQLAEVQAAGAEVADLEAKIREVRNLGPGRDLVIQEGMIGDRPEAFSLVQAGMKEHWLTAEASAPSADYLDLMVRIASSLTLEVKGRKRK